MEVTSIHLKKKEYFNIIGKRQLLDIVSGGKFLRGVKAVLTFKWV